MLHVTIMAGGSGTRFWPASRRTFPKQFLSLAGSDSMLVSTVRRLEGLCPAEQISVFTNRSLAATTQSQLADTRIAVVGEPAKRDTAPCVALAAAMAVARDPNAVVLTLPADHVIQPVDSFHQAIRQALDVVDRDDQQLVTLGIAPTYPAEIYGYIERGEPIARGKFPTYGVRQFREKPDLATARDFLRQRTFYWNAGIFIYRATTMLAALREYEPTLMHVIDRVAQATDDPSFEAVLAEWFPQAPAKSIDYAVLERYPHVVVIEAPFQWDDVGNWLALERLRGHDSSGNTIDAPRFLGIQTKGCIVRSPGDHLLVTLGISDLIVVHTPDATLVAHKRDESALRQIVQEIEARGWTDYL